MVRTVVIVGAVDIGSNSVRLLIVDDEFTVLVNERTLTGLGAGVDATRHFAPSAMDKTLAVMDEFADLLRMHDVDRVGAVATSATRDAVNGAAFVAQVAEHLGTVPEVISGEREAALSFTGATRRRTDGPHLVIDIGGGSTEFIRGHGTIESAVSIDIGCVRLADRCDLADVVAALAVDAARAMAAQAFAGVPKADGATVLGVAGTFNALATHQHRRNPYHHTSFGESSVTLAGITAATAELAPMTAAERGVHPHVHRDRASTIVSGAIIAAAALDVVGVTSAIVTPRGLTHGLAAELLAT